MSALRPFLAALFLVFGVQGIAHAHVTEIAVLKITEVTEDEYAVTWELRPSEQAAATLQPIFPAHCTQRGNRLTCADRGLVGKLGFEGIGAGQSAAMFKLRELDGSVRVFTLTPAKPFVDVSPSYSADSWAGTFQIVTAYVAIGVEHIMLGIDHLLFVLGLIWIARGRWMLVKTITAFTVAHSITLGAVTFGWVGVPEPLVNALIALSIVFIGVEILHARAGRSTVTLRNPWAVSFFFGLLHGFGFANALIALGLPESAIPLALVSFNVGVEIGQIAFVFGVLALAWAYRVMQVTWPSWSHVAPAYLIGSLGALWFYQRTVIVVGG